MHFMTRGATQGLSQVMSSGAMASQLPAVPIVCTIQGPKRSPEHGECEPCLSERM